MHYGLFGRTGNGSSIRNLRLTGVNIDLTFSSMTEDRYVGALVAYLRSRNSSAPESTLATVSVQGTVTVNYSGAERAYVGGLVGRSSTRARMTDRIAFVGDVGGTFSSTKSSRGANYGGLVGRTSQDATLSLGYAVADIEVTAGAGNATDIYVGVLTGSPSSEPSVLQELYAVGSATINGTAPSGSEYLAGAVGLIENADDTFRDIYYLDGIRPDKAFAGGQVGGFDPMTGLQNVVALLDAEMRGAQPATMMTGTDGRWEYANGPTAVAGAVWLLALSGMLVVVGLVGARGAHLVTSRSRALR